LPCLLNATPSNCHSGPDCGWTFSNVEAWASSSAHRSACISASRDPSCAVSPSATGSSRPQQALYFFPLPHGHGSFLPGLTSTTAVWQVCNSILSGKERNMIIRAGQRRIHCDLIGPSGGPVACFAHSLSSDSGIWSEQLPPLLAQGWQVLRVDMRGHGGSGP